MIDLILAAVYSLTISNTYGRIGVLINNANGTVSKVHRYSPAYDAGLQKNDKVISVDGKKNATENIDGDAFSPVVLVIHRKGIPDFSVTIVREPKEFIRDK